MGTVSIHFARMRVYSYFETNVRASDGTVKGNVDAELVLHTMIEYKHFDKAIIVSGDGDFLLFS